MTTIAKLFADARQGIQPPVSARTEHFIDLDIAGECFHGSLSVSRELRRHRYVGICEIRTQNDGGISFLNYAQGANAAEALGKVERKLEAWAVRLAELQP